jgi:hypothetical protein
MLFDPQIFIQLASRSGLQLTQIDGKVLVRVTPGTNVDLWAEVIVRHKPALLGYLPSEPERDSHRP